MRTEGLHTDEKGRYYYLEAVTYEEIKSVLEWNISRGNIKRLQQVHNLDDFVIKGGD